MLSETKLARFLLLPELKLIAWKNDKTSSNRVEAEKQSMFEVCPKCATPSSVGYDHRFVTVRDSPVRGKGVRLKIRKRRFYCRTYRKPFIEPVSGIDKGQRRFFSCRWFEQLDEW